MKLRRIATITKKEFIHIKRDKASLVIALLMPVMMLILFGFAVNTDVNNVKFVVYDGSKTVKSRQIIDKFNNSDYFRLYRSAENQKDVEDSINRGETKVGIVIPADYGKKINRGEKTEIQVLVDGSDPTIARTAMSYSLIIANNLSIKLKQSILPKTALQSGASLTAKPYVLYNPSLESSKFNLPGVIGLILQNITIILTSFAMVREREKGTIEQLIMTPITSFELICGKIIPYIFIGFMDFIMVLLLSNVIFGMTVKGSLVLLTLLGMTFLICALAMGMLISTVSKTQLQAMQASIAVLLPSVLLSGFIFPRESMPKIIYMISEVLPLTYFLEILRGIIVKGVVLSYLKSSVISLSILIVLIVAATMFKFRKTLD